MRYSGHYFIPFLYFTGQNWSYLILVLQRCLLLTMIAFSIFWLIILSLLKTTFFRVFNLWSYRNIWFINQFFNFLVVYLCPFQSFFNKNFNDFENFLQKSSCVIEVIKFMIVALSEVFIRVRVQRFLFVSHQWLFLRKNEDFQRLDLFEDGAEWSLIFQNCQDNWLHVLDIKHIVLIDHT